MNGKSTILTAMLLAAAAAPLRAGLLSATGVSVLDNSGAARATFTNNERLRLQARINNAAASTNFIRFAFSIQDPGGQQVFRHQGNAAPGRVGNAATNVSGVPISRFYTTPGVYTLVATAELDGQTVSQSTTFTVSSPNILLTYPPNGSQGLTDQPLIFRWNSSGAAQYRLTIRSHSQGLIAIFNEKIGAQNFFAYNGTPLSAGADEVYDWKIEGLDQNGNKIAESDVPYTFTLATSDPLTRDLAVNSLSIVNKQGYSIRFRVVAANQGGTTESNVELKFSLGGLAAPGSPVTLPLLSPGAEKEYEFVVEFPSDQQQSLATACLAFFDDNVPNNCKTMQVTKPPVDGGDSSAIFDGGRQLTMEELWSSIESVLADRGMDFSDYGLVPGDPGMTASDLAALLDALQRGLVEIEVTGPPADEEPPPAYIPPPISAGPAPELDLGEGESGSGDGESKSAEPVDTSELGRDWRGNAPALSGRLMKVLLRDSRSLEKYWSRVSHEKPPQLDFSKYMIVGVMAGSRDRANGLELVDVRETPRGLEVRYQMMVDVTAKAGSERASVPFHLMVIPQSGLAVDFKSVQRQHSGLAEPAKAKKDEKGKEKAVPPGNAWGAIRAAMLASGLDFEGFEVLEMAPELTPEEMKALLEQLKDGSASVSVGTR